MEFLVPVAIGFVLGVVAAVVYPKVFSKGQRVVDEFKK